MVKPSKKVMTADLTDCSLEELNEEREKLIAKYIGEWDKGVWYYKRLEYIDELIAAKY
jgi:hypothetical protein